MEKFNKPEQVQKYTDIIIGLLQATLLTAQAKMKMGETKNCFAVGFIIAATWDVKKSARAVMDHDDAEVLTKSTISLLLKLQLLEDVEINAKKALTYFEQIYYQASRECQEEENGS